MKLIIANKTYSSWSLRAWLMLKASGHTFEEISILLRQPETHSQILRWSPSGKVPCLIDSGIAVWDSLAIAEYLAEESPPLWPLDGAARAIARSVSAEMHSGFQALRNQMPMNLRRAAPLASHSPELAADIRRIEQIWNESRAQHGSHGRFLFGSYSIADMMFAPVCFRFDSYGVRLHGAAQDYLQTMLAHPHMQEWKEAAADETAVIPDYDV
ncbi:MULTISPECIES: glutathione S-transferase family protein [unclassified Uliginosibacterium]|uniref:glutathione S-transferase family protein n=1 Tax=unclassified Uliginosibacterium TaxID=2621521 RepID=UPI000C7E30A3|nr:MULTISPECIES: glutathione S-transferase family protein [unclassified Uliginosibacterium]MDO6386690.1 glutathione S-transferase family protein [Uliginosibacterium sp. 31-12]PLK50518.1 glutathione S-transferase [Uliginosibacterium sp. TH139]